MNYHILVDDKFIDSFICDVKELNEEENNIFWVRSNDNIYKHIKEKEHVEWIGNDKTVILEKISQINTDDIIFVHWYDDFIADIIHHISNVIVVFFWGGEMYEIP